MCLDLTQQSSWFNHDNDSNALKTKRVDGIDNNIHMTSCLLKSNTYKSSQALTKKYGRFLTNRRKVKAKYVFSMWYGLHMCLREKRHVESKSHQENQELKSTNRTLHSFINNYASQILQRINLYLTDKVLKIRITCLYFTDINQKG
jgi:hypothetical protein